MKKNYILSFLLLLILNCEKEKNENIAIFFNKTDTFFLNSESVFIRFNEDTQLNNVAEMIYIDSLLIIYDYNINYKMKVADLRKKTIYNFGKKGRGPKELKSPYMKYSIDHASNKMYVSDLPDYCVYSIDSLRQGNMDMIFRFDIKSDSISFFSSVFCSDYIIGGAIRKRFGLYNIKEGKSILKYDFEKKQGALTSQANFYNHPFKNKVAYFQLFSEVMGILTINNNDININEKVWWKNNDKEINDNNRTFIEPSKDRRNCFINASVSNKYLYSLYSGKPLGSSIETLNESLSSDIIYVFDWEGNPIKKLKLDRKIQSLAIDNQDEILYATSLENDESIIIKFKINEPK